MSLTPSTPNVPNPAKRPERSASIEPEDIVLGTDNSGNEDDRKGRRALRRPSGNVQGGSEPGVGTGLSA